MRDERIGPAMFGRELPEAEEASQGGIDLHHDEWLMPAPGSHLATLAQEVFADTERLSPRNGRKPRADALHRRSRIIGNLVANLAMVACDTQRGGLAVSAKNEALTRYARADFPREVLAKSLAALSLAGVAHRTTGTRNQTRTVLTPSRAFRRRLAGTTSEQIIRAPGAETIILRARTGERDWGRGGGSRKVLIDYEDTSETHAMRAEMGKINEALTAARITYAGEPVPPFLLFRSFVIADPRAPRLFDQHGRIFGGPWIGMPREDRHCLRLDGEELADLDFTGMFVQLAYLTAALPLPEGDPYSGVEGLTGGRGGDAEGDGRDAVKRSLAALLCRSGPMRKLPVDIKRRIGEHWTAARLTGAIAARHPRIAHLFGSDIGVRLMFTESRVLVRTLLALITQGIPALPVHDGIMVGVSKREAAMAAMSEASKAVTGVALPVKAKTL